ncbi:sulfite exporter TauE/SafE family protein [Sphingomonas crusticola]|uniref:sulfite exporter TauE/SafE family protein n=1 Tax=Sphingomonas crusticola TaxID=1697973 RepID=UPI000E23937C|nr:sulfite exporter TauE/SafE family protein [Sphingomonas crusticola]
MALLHDPWFLAAGGLAVLLLGLSKGGFAGVGAIGTPLLALVVAPVEAAAIMLPILIAQDVVGVWAFRRTWDGRIIALMLPGAALGVGLAYLFAANVPEGAMQVLLGAISILFAIRSLWLQRGGRIPAPADPPGWFGFAMGVASGITSQIAHAGQPPFQIYVLPRRLPRDVLVGTTAIFFAALNWIKVPAYVALGQFTRDHLLASLILLPIAIPATFAGVWLVRRVDADRFYILIYWLMLLIGAKLVYDGLR